MLCHDYLFVVCGIVRVNEGMSVFYFLLTMVIRLITVKAHCFLHLSGRKSNFVFGKSESLKCVIRISLNFAVILSFEAYFVVHGISSCTESLQSDNFTLRRRK